MNGYGFNFQDKVFTPDGKADFPPSDTDTRNRETEAREIEWLKTAPEKVFLYAHLPYAKQNSGAHAEIRTWLGTSVATDVCMDQRRYMGFGHNTYRRAVTCRIFGVLYHGWYFESSGDYCRLKKAKRQGGR